MQKEELKKIKEELSVLKQMVDSVITYVERLITKG
jgi:hypothetical protein|tara:strand:+ start:45792 stop:45896 length:105 start_codon:yes stop_codon:yes gene_type:complete